MMNHPSRHLSAAAWRGLNRLGDALLPGDGALPSFSTLGCAEHVDVVLDEMAPSDRDSLKLLLAFCAYVPRPLLVGLFALLERGTGTPGPLGRGIRFLRMGLKGLLLTLYYSGNRGAAYAGPTPLDVIEYQVSVYTGDLEPPA